MIGQLARRCFELTVAGFALLGFCFVPLGERTGLEHARALLGTPQAQVAGEELIQAGDRLRRTLGGESGDGADPEPVVDDTPEQDRAERRQAKRAGEAEGGDSATQGVRRRRARDGAGRQRATRRQPATQRAPQPGVDSTFFANQKRVAVDAGVDASLVWHPPR